MTFFYLVDSVSNPGNKLKTAWSFKRIFIIRIKALRRKNAAHFV